MHINTHRSYACKHSHNHLYVLHQWKHALLLDFQIKVACQMWKLSSRNPNKRKMDFGKMTQMALQRRSWHNQVMIPENTWHFHYPAYRLTGFKGAGVKLWLLFDLMWSSCHASGVLFDSVTLMTAFFYFKWSWTPKVVENTKHTADSTFWHSIWNISPPCA